MKFEVFDWQSLKGAPVIGVDEVGRGCLAGPVYAAAVILNPKNDFSAFTDSKLLSESRREELNTSIQRDHHFAIGFATVAEITKYNILQASLLAMKRAVLGLGVSQGHILVDGKIPIPEMKGFLQTPLVKGDLRAAPVAAASIVAKVTRDQLLKDLALDYPQYGFDQHKGYSTAIHMEAIKRFGPCEIHRPTFAGVREYLNIEKDLG